MVKQTSQRPAQRFSLPKSPTGIQGLDEITGGRLSAGRPMLVRLWPEPISRFAEEEKIIAAPILSKKLTLPLRRFFGDMPQTGGILPGLDLRKLGDKTTNE